MDKNISTDIQKIENANTNKALGYYRQPKWASRPKFWVH